MTEFKPLKSDAKIFIDTNLYSKTAVIRTCYALSDIAHFWLAEGDVSGFYVEIAKMKPDDAIEAIKETFAHSLIDFSLREDIEKKTASIRETIVKAAMAEVKGAA